MSSNSKLNKLSQSPSKRKHTNINENKSSQKSPRTYRNTNTKTSQSMKINTRHVHWGINEEKIISKSLNNILDIFKVVLDKIQNIRRHIFTFIEIYPDGTIHLSKIKTKFFFTSLNERQKENIVLDSEKKLYKEIQNIMIILKRAFSNAHVPFYEKISNNVVSYKENTDKNNYQKNEYFDNDVNMNMTNYDFYQICMFCENFNLDLDKLEMKLDFDKHFVNSSYKNVYDKRDTSYSIYNLMLYIYRIVSSLYQKKKMNQF